jgi:hypothetical protein
MFAPEMIRRRDMGPESSRAVKRSTVPVENQGKGIETVGYPPSATRGDGPLKRRRPDGTETASVRGMK